MIAGWEKMIFTSTYISGSRGKILPQENFFREAPFCKILLCTSTEKLRVCLLELFFHSLVYRRIYGKPLYEM